MSKKSIYAGGLKFDVAKPRYELFPPAVLLELIRRRRFNPVGSHALREVAVVYALGAAKYEVDNWARGMKFSRLLGAAYRHLHAYFAGEIIDRSTGVNHLACVVFSVAGLISYHNHLRCEEYDDRTTELRLTAADVETFQDFFLGERDSIKQVHLMLLFYTGRVGVMGGSELETLYCMLEQLFSRLDEDVRLVWESSGQEDFIEDVQRVGREDLVADLDSSDLPVPILDTLPGKSNR